MNKLSAATTSTRTWMIAITNFDLQFDALIGYPYPYFMHKTNAIIDGFLYFIFRKEATDINTTQKESQKIGILHDGNWRNLFRCYVIQPNHQQVSYLWSFCRFWGSFGSNNIIVYGSIELIREKQTLKWCFPNLAMYGETEVMSWSPFLDPFHQQETFLLT